MIDVDLRGTLTGIRVDADGRITVSRVDQPDTVVGSLPVGQWLHVTTMQVRGRSRVRATVTAETTDRCTDGV